MLPSSLWGIAYEGTMSMLADQLILKRLEGGLVLRRAAAADAKALADFNVRVHEDESVRLRAFSLMDGRHPTACAGKACSTPISRPFGACGFPIGPPF